GAALAVLVWFGSFFVNTRTELEMTAFAVRYGESILIEAPDRSDILINGGAYTKEGGAFDNGQRTLLPSLSKKLIRSLDLMIATSLSPECFTGLHTTFANTYVANLVLPYDPAVVRTGMAEDAFLTAVGGEEMARQVGLAENEALYREVVAGYPDLVLPSFSELIDRRAPTLVNRWADWDVNVRQGKGGDALLNTSIDGIPYRIEVLSPVRPYLKNPVENNSLVLRVTYGQTAFLLTSDIAEEALADLLQQPAEKLRADVLVFPRHGTLDLTDQELDTMLSRVQPKAVLFCYTRDRNNPRSYDDFMTANWERCVARLGIANCFRTDAHGAVIVTSDGSAVKLDSMAARSHRRVLEVSDDVISAIDVAY
ncbi:MAG TPA: hypothetical protein PKM88_08420, partial [bacterium]|nr:hypothetical protein [bacterium]